MSELEAWTQEDFCQVLNVPSAHKYESQGGPGIRDIMSCLLGSANADHERRNFMKAQVLFWLLAATDGHAKNFSVFIEDGGSFRLAPLYDIMSAYPLIEGRGLSVREAKLSMRLAGGKGKKYAAEWIFPRHFLKTVKAVGFERSSMEEIMTEMYISVDAVLERAARQLPQRFPCQVSDAILGGLKARSSRLESGSWN